MEKNGAALSKYALVGLVLGIISFFNIMGMEKAIAAIVFGVLGLIEIKKNPDALKGKGMAVAGIVLGAAMVALVVIITSNADYFRSLQK